jgi:hypothetical protein
VSPERAPFPAQVDGVATRIVPAADVLDLGSRVLDWNDVDGLDVSSTTPLRLTLTLADGTAVLVDHLGPRGDEFADLVREFRGSARRAALTQVAARPLGSFLSRGPDGAISDVHLFPGSLVVEPRSSAPILHLPLPLVREVTREGWTFTFDCRGLPDAELRGLGQRTDEFVIALERARTDLAAATRAALTAFEPALAGLDVPDGWAVTPGDAGQHGPALVARWAAGNRATELAALAAAAGDRLRYGMWTDGGTHPLPFVLAPVGSGDSQRVAVEAIDADDRATFVFAAGDLERLNAALVICAFRREAIALPEAELGRWAVAVRTQPHVQWMRERLVARVVHGAGWADGVGAALGVPGPA